MIRELAKNIIYTGVAGTGKTYQLQQIAKQYTEFLPTATQDDLLKNLVEPLSWREVICLVLLDEKQKGKSLLKVPELVQSAIFLAKASLKDRKENLNQTAWGTLMMYSDKNSVRVKYHRRASQSYFDKDDSSNWFLLADSLPLLTDLQNKLDDYQAAIHSQFQPNYLQPKLERFSFVSFHQAYGYEEFVEGIRPHIADNGQMSYRVESGAFLRLCQQAKHDPSHRYAMLIDEINRANVARVFGELMSLIEPSKRAGQTDSLSVNLAYSRQPFSVPSNVDIYATMNSQDHSLAPLDMAFRRRFEFIEYQPQPQLLGKVMANGMEIDLAKLLTALNERISQNLAKDSQLGHSFLWGIDSLHALSAAFSQSIIPQVAQACQHHGQILQAIFGQRFIRLVDNKKATGFMAQQAGFDIHTPALDDPNSYLAIYQSAQ
ncbi:McrB family protein [Moraxella osloensis]|uniref:5-methylcytosine-specific restriction enzyme B n=1 Tax=Faucicola osloensis TaxID=34062 RepID=A0A378Q856_FAUOS|nr:AAA family ATPase [Moraxella osloensis]QPT41485.1 AAA family ATPase [Moraxella osloensis]STY97023.1 5-methylcytosine-specific restriction enzyme B [Moraxella osloensis]